LTAASTVETQAVAAPAAQQPAVAAAATAAQVNRLGGRAAACAATVRGLHLLLQQTAALGSWAIRLRTATGHRAHRKRMAYRVQLEVYTEKVVTMP
jgi:hypothetical protein